MSAVKEISQKIRDKKEEKKQKLLDAANDLFSLKGFKETSVQEIVTHAGVAKGTFYLYFPNKEAIREQLIEVKAQEYFTRVIQKAEKKGISPFSQRVVFIINLLIDELKNDQAILRFFNRDLSLGYYSQEFSKLFNNNYGLQSYFTNGMMAEGYTKEKADILFFMLVDFVSTTTYRSMTDGIPIDIDTYKPYLFQTISYILSL
ncbi:MAG: TetR/AcrR family transcriptional regulator [bacterium]